MASSNNNSPQRIPGLGEEIIEWFAEDLTVEPDADIPLDLLNSPEFLDLMTREFVPTLSDQAQAIALWKSVKDLLTNLIDADLAFAEEV